jgi:ABC-2 type transport system permease protein
MRNLWLVARREFVTRAKSGGYIITTLLMMVLLLGSNLAPAFFEERNKAEVIPLLILDQTGQVQGQLIPILGDRTGGQVNPQAVTGDEAALTDEVLKEGKALLVIEGTYPHQLKARLLAGSPAQLSNAGMILGPLEEVVRAARMQARGIDPAAAAEIMHPLETEAKQITASGQGRDQQAYMGSLLVALGIVMVLYMVVLTNGQFVFQGVLEEKVSRVVEVMTAAVGPGEMLVGKLIALGALGLIQFVGMILAWAGGTVLAKDLIDMPVQGIKTSGALLALTFLILGYILSASLMAAAAATISRMEDQNTVMMPIVVLQALPMVMTVSVMSDPNGSLAVVLSLIPFFSQSVMVMRVLLGDVPTWQIVTSIGLMVLTTAFSAWAGGRIYRAALLSYGARPSMRQLISYLRAG